MSDKRKFGPIRQLSLQSEIRRPLLKKQLSVEHLESISEHKPPRAESAKSNKLSDRPRPVKVAWAETRQQSRDEPSTPKSRYGDPVEVKKCKEHKRPVTAKARTPDKQEKLQIEKESILYPRQELAERLRKAWKDREENKQNIDIFLGTNKQIDDEEEQPEVCYQKIETVKTQKVQKQKSLTAEFSYIPSTTSSRPQDVRTNISVTIPITINQKAQESFESPEEPPSIPPDPIIKALPPRPSTAASKRESFQKRTNTAFTGSISSPSAFRPPLSRTLSTPVKSDGQKLKFIATKRRLKSAKRKGKEDEQQQVSGDEGEEGEEKTTKKGSRCKSAPHGELVTMVSLVSPAGSDTEEQDKKEVRNEEEKSSEPVKTPALRKTAKSVSFQQSSIHTVRSFSASFPSRRHVMSALPSGSATGAMAAEREKRAPVESPPGPGDTRGPKRRLVRAVSVGGEEARVANQRSGSSIHTVRSFSASFPSRRHVMSALPSGSATGAMAAEREKRAPVESPPGPGDTRGPKRRLVRAVSVGGEEARVANQRSGSFDDSSSDPRPRTPPVPVDPKQTLGVTRAEILPAKKQDSTEKKREEDETEDKENTESFDDPSIPKFESNKERECWVMYKKMSDKGLPVSFDTILRGMLTPTEYRSVRKEMKVST